MLYASSSTGYARSRTLAYVRNRFVTLFIQWPRNVLGDRRNDERREPLALRRRIGRIHIDLKHGTVNTYNRPPAFGVKHGTIERKQERN